LISDGKLVVDQRGEILYVGKWDGEASGELITWDGIVVPGLVNAHVHLELSALKNKTPKGVGVTYWVEKVQTKRSLLDPNEISRAIISSLEEMETLGIVAIGEVGNNFYGLEYLRDARMKVVYFYEILGFMPKMAEEIFYSSLNKLEHFRRKYPEVEFFIAPHALYSTSEELIRMIFSQKEFRITTIHLSEGKEENELLEKGKGPWKTYIETLGKWPSNWICPGLSPISYFKTLAPEKRTILVHLCNISSDEIMWLSKQNRFIPCCCPRSNLYITGELPPIDKFWRSKIPVALGTDSLASNDSLSIWDEMRVVKRHFPEIPDEDILKMATLNSAWALGLEDELGSLDLGKRPGVLLVEAYNLEESLQTEKPLNIKRMG
jgi:cytosine/adenosine deaminase-related metal-dependent hydrolase